jgi:hypothetical protein
MFFSPAIVGHRLPDPARILNLSGRSNHAKCNGAKKVTPRILPWIHGLTPDQPHAMIVGAGRITFDLYQKEAGPG